MFQPAGFIESMVKPAPQLAGTASWQLGFRESKLIKVAGRVCRSKARATRQHPQVSLEHESEADEEVFGFE